METGQGGDMIEVGSKVPAISAALSDGSILDLAASGGKLLLYFYPKDRNGSEGLKALSSADNC